MLWNFINVIIITNLLLFVIIYIHFKVFKYTEFLLLKFFHSHIFTIRILFHILIQIILINIAFK